MGANFNFFLGVENEAVSKRVTKHIWHAQLKVKLFLFLTKHHIIKTCVGNWGFNPIYS